MPNEIKSLYHITHRDNVPSILKYGILSHAAVESLATKSNGGFLSRMRSWFNGGTVGDFALPRVVYNPDVVALRKDRSTPDGKSLWEYANFYINARNPMLFTVHRGGRDVVVLELSPAIMKTPGAFISIGNAAVSASPIVPVADGVRQITEDKMWEKVNADWWNRDEVTRVLVMSEVLVPERVAPEHITAVYVPTHDGRRSIEGAVGALPISVEAHTFFNPKSVTRITERIQLVDSDMFLSRLQTLTISVNTVGIMGKGQAARAREQFPTAFKVYRQACNSKKIALGKPFVYSRSSTDYEWGVFTDEMKDTGAGSKLLFFPTKGHWREDAKIGSIVQGLKWLIDNWEQEGITSIALPALGCGLGNLSWAQVAPLMCRALSRIPIQSEIYLPREMNIPANEKTREFLLRNK